MSSHELAAIIATVVLALLICFQLLLAAGLPHPQTFPETLDSLIIYGKTHIEWGRELRG